MKPRHEKLPGRATTLRGYLVHMYRTGEDYRRYIVENEARREALTALFRKNRRYFGQTILDLGCGGGILGTVLGPLGRSYVGVDANPDMIEQARRAAKITGFGQRFVLGDIKTVRVQGRFDTVTILGNTLGHLTLGQLDNLLHTRSANVHRGSSFLVDYRDLISMFWQGSWKSVQIQKHLVTKVVSRATTVDLQRGMLEMRARPATGKWVLDWGHAIWSPFILENLMQHHGWRLLHRSGNVPGRATKKIPEHYVDVYRLE